MKELDYFKRQFLLTVHENFDLPWVKKKILNFNLFYHPDLEFEHSINERIELYLLGFLFDYRYPVYSNKNILDSLSKNRSFDQFLENLSEFSGHYVIIYKSEERLIILNDACAQHEIYYDTSYTSFGTQPKLLSKVIPLIPHSSFKAAEFYSSKIFISKKTFIGETTHVENIKHLLPNHYIDIRFKSVIRFFPKHQIKSLSIDEAAIKTCEMLKGFIKAASLRHKIYMGVTAGYDSRTLFLASLDLECKYYVTKLNNMDYWHNDIIIPQKLTKMFNKEFKIISESPIDNEETQIQEMSIDFPREFNKPDGEYNNCVLINGNISEIARNHYGYYQKISPEDLTFLVGYSTSEFVCREYEKWMKGNSLLFSENGYNLLDMFYWENRIGIWAAKGKTEMSVFGTNVYSPFCSHALLKILLSTPRKHRDSLNNKLYYRIFSEFSTIATKIPINPSRKKKIKRILQILRLYNIYRIIGLKYRLIAPVHD